MILSLLPAPRMGGGAGAGDTPPLCPRCLIVDGAEGLRSVSSCMSTMT